MSSGLTTSRPRTFVSGFGRISECQRSGLERRIATEETFRRWRNRDLGEHFERRVWVDDEEGLLGGFHDRRGPDHFAPAVCQWWPEREARWWRRRAS